MYKGLHILVLLWSMVAVGSVNAAEEFEGRAKYPEVQFIELEDLRQKQSDVVIVDVRSSLEYDTLRVKGALNIPLSESTFDDALLKLRESTDKTIVFYCNGRTCHKSYKAARRAGIINVPDTVAFDAGIFDWVRAYPDEGELLGESPVKPDDLIDGDKFKAHLLEPAEFVARIPENSLVMDVRDPTQRAGVRFFGVERTVSLNDGAKIDSLLREAKEAGKTLLIYDQVGKQVRWLQYRLERAGLDQYYFMKGGADAYYEVLAQKFKDQYGN